MKKKKKKKKKKEERSGNPQGISRCEVQRHLCG